MWFHRGAHRDLPEVPWACVFPLLLPQRCPATPLFLPTVFPTETSTPVATDTPPPTVTPRGTLTPTKEPDYKSTPWAQYECPDKSQIILRGGVREEW